MRVRPTARLAFFCLLSFGAAANVFSQGTQPPTTQPPPPPIAPGTPPAQPPATAPPSADKPWTLSFGAGLAATSGNKDTFTFNVGYDVAYDPKQRNSIRSEGLLLRGETEGDLTADRLGLSLRDEYRVVDGVFIFGQAQYLRDPFKDIDYLFAPTSGLGIFVIDTDRTTLSFDAGLGGIWEKRLRTRVTSSGALSYSEKLWRQISENASFVQSFSALHKTDAVDDALYTLSVVIAAALTPRTQLKIEGLDSYKTHFPTTGFVKNDMAVLVAFVYKT